MRADFPHTPVKPFHHGRSVYREQRDQQIRNMPIVRERVSHGLAAWVAGVVGIVSLVLLMKGCGA